MQVAGKRLAGVSPTHALSAKPSDQDVPLFSRPSPCPRGAVNRQVSRGDRASSRRRNAEHGRPRRGAPNAGFMTPGRGAACARRARPADRRASTIEQKPADTRHGRLDRLAGERRKDLKDEAAEVRVRLGSGLMRTERVCQKSIGMLIPVLRPFDKTQREACEPSSIVHVAIISQATAGNRDFLGRRPLARLRSIALVGDPENGLRRAAPK